MNIVLLFPAAFAIWWMKSHTTGNALRNIYIPVLLLFPLYFDYRMKGLPPIDDAQAIMWVFAAFILIRHREELYFSTTDLWLGAYVYGVLISEAFHSNLSDGIYGLINDIGSGILPYLCGKMFIEQYGERTAMLKRMCWLLMLVAIGSLYEFRMGANPYHKFIGPYFDNEGSAWLTQMRWGHTRVSGPYAHAIIAGMVFLTAVIFNVWLLRFHKWEDNFSRFRVKWISKGGIIMFWLLVGEFLTQSRGPWVGLIFGFAVSLIGFAYNTRKAFIRFLLICAVVGFFVYPIVNEYTAGNRNDAKDLDQQNAVYRRELLKNYTPVVQAGGMFGWGQVQFPIVNGQQSIDNEYLYLAVTRGYIGVSCFILLFADAIVSLIRTGLKFHDREDRLFAFCLIGAIAGSLFAMTTVYLGNQMYNILFLLAGWSQAIGRKIPGQDKHAKFQAVLR